MATFNGETSRSRARMHTLHNKLASYEQQVAKIASHRAMTSFLNKFIFRSKQIEGVSLTKMYEKKT